MARRSHYTEINDASFLSTLNEDMDAVHRRLDRAEKRKQFISGVTVGITQTEIRHKLGVGVVIKSIIPKGTGNVWQSANPTHTSIFLKASASVIVDIELEQK